MRAAEQAVYWLPATLVDGNARDVDLVRTFRDSLAAMKHPL
jgi:hypothetical protein